MVDILSDAQREAEQICNRGIEAAEEADLPGAHKLFQQAFEKDPASAKVLSWYGFTTGMVDRKVQKGMEYCRKAIESQIPDALFYRNIGVLYLQQHNKRAAIGAFAKGLQIDKGNRAILKEWKALGFRRKQLVSFLDRDHWLNKTIGKFTWWLKYRGKKPT